MNNSRMLSTLLAMALIPALAACGGLLQSDRPGEHTWWLEPAPLNAAAEPAPDRQLMVSLSVVPGLDTDRIVTLDADARLNHYAGARWADHSRELLESLVVRSLANAGTYAAVSPRHQPVTGACHLELEVQKFYARLDVQERTRSVNIELAGSHDCQDQRKAVAASASIPVSGNHMPTVVAAFQRGFEEVMQSLSAQL